MKEEEINYTKKKMIGYKIQDLIRAKDSYVCIRFISLFDRLEFIRLYSDIFDMPSDEDLYYFTSKKCSGVLAVITEELTVLVDGRTPLSKPYTFQEFNKLMGVTAKIENYPTQNMFRNFMIAMYNAYGSNNIILRIDNYDELDSALSLLSQYKFCTSDINKDKILREYKNGGSLVGIMLSYNSYGACSWTEIVRHKPIEPMRMSKQFDPIISVQEMLEWFKSNAITPVMKDYESEGET